MQDGYPPFVGKEPMVSFYQSNHPLPYNISTNNYKKIIKFELPGNILLVWLLLLLLWLRFSDLAFSKELFPRILFMLLELQRKVFLLFPFLQTHEGSMIERERYFHGRIVWIWGGGDKGEERE